MPAQPILPSCRSRFAPTPSGLLHIGSLSTAVASYLTARSRNGLWLLRIDDLDRPRCLPGADAAILRQLETHGLHWDEAPRYQSAHLEEYRLALSLLHDTGRLYACRCTRADLAGGTHLGPDSAGYPGHCRLLGLPAGQNALRFAIRPELLQIEDAVQGVLHREAESEVGDVVVRRRDGIYGYHLACTVDEHAMRITDVVRGADLIGSTFSQLALAQALNLPSPLYAHVPVLVGSDGRKLSKQNRAPAVEPRNAAANLWQCLLGLQQNPPLDLHGARPEELLQWASAHWKLAPQLARRSIAVEASSQNLA